MAAPKSNEPIEASELLEIEWPAHLVPEILASLLEADLSGDDEDLARRRLAKGSISAFGDGGGRELLVVVLRACLTFAGKGLSSSSESRETRKSPASPRSSRAVAWCVCAVRVLRKAISPDYACAYDILRAQFIRFPRLGAAALAAFERETRASSVDDNDDDVTGFDYGVHAWDFILLAAISSNTFDDNTARDAIARLGAASWRLAAQDIDNGLSTWFMSEDARRHLFEVCVAHPTARVTISVLPALVNAWPACRPAVLRMCASGFARDDARGDWTKILDLVAEQWQDVEELGEEEKRSVAEMSRGIPEMAATRGLRAACRVARALTKITVVSDRSTFETAVLCEARAWIDGGGAPAKCGLFVASELLSLRRDNDASELLDAGVASRDDLVKCASYEMMCNYAPGTITASTIEGAFGFAIEAVRSMGVVGSTQSSPALPGATRILLIRSDRCVSKVSRDDIVAFTGALNDAFVRVKNSTLEDVEETALVTLRASFEVMIDAVLNVSFTTKPEEEPHLLNLLEAHATMTTMLREQSPSVTSVDASSALCCVSLRGCAALLDVASASMSFTAEHRAHVADLAARCARDARSPASFPVREDTHDVIQRCSMHATSWWRAWTTDAEVAAALRLLKENVSFVASNGDPRDARSLSRILSEITTDDERVKAARAVSKRVHSALGKNKYDAVGRAARVSPTCGATAVFCNTLHDHLRRVDFSEEVAAATIDVVGALEPLIASNASKFVVFVVDASMNSLRDVMFDARVTKSALATLAMGVAVSHYRQSESSSERAAELADVLFQVAPNVARGELLEPTTMLLTALQSDLRELAEGDARSLDVEALTEVSAATLEILNSIIIHSRAKRKGGLQDSIMDDAPGMSSTAVSAVNVASRCLDVARKVPASESSESQSTYVDLRRAVEMLLRRKILPEQVSRALEPWHRELFFESVRVVPDGGNVERSTRTQASLADKVVWCDEWSEHADGEEKGAAELLGQLAMTSDAVGGRAKQRPTQGKKKKMKRKRKDMNPFVEALKESEGRGKGRAQDWDDLEDFIVCKPGRDYRRMLGLEGQRLRAPSPKTKTKPRARVDDGPARSHSPAVAQSQPPRQRFHERCREQLIEKALAGTLGKPDEGQFYRGGRGSLFCMKCRSCLNPSLRRKCEALGTVQQEMDVDS